MVRITRSNEPPQEWITEYQGPVVTIDGRAAKLYTVRHPEDALFPAERIQEAREVIDRVLRHDVGDLEIGFAALTPRHLTVAMWERHLVAENSSYLLHPHTFPYDPSKSLRLLPHPPIYALPQEMIDLHIFELTLLKGYDQSRPSRDKFLEYLQSGYEATESSE